MPNFPFNIQAYVSALLAHEGIPAGGNVYFLNPGHTNASDGNDGWDPSHPLLSLAATEDRMTANQNDVLFYIGMDASITLTAALVWDKNYTHFVGLCAPTHVAQRARIFQLSSLTGASPLLTISATGCIFKNFYIFQGVADATSLINVSVSGGRNWFYNVHVAGGGHADQAVNGGTSLKLDGAEENTFTNCTFGVDTAEASDGYSTILMAGSAMRNMFSRCRIIAYPASGQTGVALVELADIVAAERYNTFEDCLFFSNSTNKTVTLASAFVIPFEHSQTASIFLLGNTRGLGFTDWDANNRAVLYLGMGTQTAGGNSGLALVSTSA